MKLRNKLAGALLCALLLSAYVAIRHGLIAKNTAWNPSAAAILYTEEE